MCCVLFDFAFVGYRLLPSIIIITNINVWVFVCIAFLYSPLFFFIDSSEWWMVSSEQRMEWSEEKKKNKGFCNQDFTCGTKFRKEAVWYLSWCYVVRILFVLMLYCYTFVLCLDELTHVINAYTFVLPSNTFRNSFFKSNDDGGRCWWRHNHKRLVSCCNNISQNRNKNHTKNISFHRLANENACSTRNRNWKNHVSSE